MSSLQKTTVTNKSRLCFSFNGVIGKIVEIAQNTVEKFFMETRIDDIEAMFLLIIAMLSTRSHSPLKMTKIANFSPKFDRKRSPGDEESLRQVHNNVVEIFGR